MGKLRGGNAPCSRGTLQFEAAKGEAIGFGRMLDELEETGYSGTELGDWGYMPSDPQALSRELTRPRPGYAWRLPTRRVARRILARFRQGGRSQDSTMARSRAREPAPFLALADKNGSVPQRTVNAGRINSQMGLSDAEWKAFAKAANSIARAVRDATGLEIVFHHHRGGYVETLDEIGRFLGTTEPQTIGLVLDTWHYVFGAGDCDMAAALDRFKGRIRYVHLKDCNKELALKSREQQWDYFQSLPQGSFYELGRGCVDFAKVLHWLKEQRYEGYVLVGRMSCGAWARRKTARSAIESICNQSNKILPNQ
jgi:inosose dehydratase